MSNSETQDGKLCEPKENQTVLEGSEASQSELAGCEGENTLGQVGVRSSESLFLGELDENAWEDIGKYGEGGKYIKYAGEGAEYLRLWWEEESVASQVSIEELEEEEETEEEKEVRRERELLVEFLRQKMIERLIVRGRNTFLQKKLTEHFKKRRMDHVLKEEPKGLDIESKYLKRLYAFQEFKQAQEKEIKELTLSMEKFETDTNLLEEKLSEKLKNFTSRAKEISLNLISSKTGKRINEKVVDRLLRRIVQKSEEKGKKNLNYIKVKNLIEEKERKLKAMEFFGEGLHISDYDQMKIDNQNYSDKAEEKEEELIKMRIKTQGIMQNLTHVKEKANAIEGNIELMQEKVFKVEQKFIQTRESLTNARRERDSLREELNHMKSVSGLLTRDDLLRDFEISISRMKGLSKRLESMEKLLSEKKKKKNRSSN